MTSQTWLDVDTDAPKPDHAAVAASRAALRFTVRDPKDPALAAVEAAFRDLTERGEVAAVTVDVADDPACRWFLTRNRFDEYGILPALLAAPEVLAAVPGLDVGQRIESETFAEHNAVELDGSIASALIWGASERSYRGRAVEAKRIGRAFSDGLVGDRYDDFRFDDSHDAWSDWFDDVAWDFTWVVTDRRARTMTLLMVTDTDAEHE